MIKVAITGASGFVGQNLLPYLRLRSVDTIEITRSDLENPHNSIIPFSVDCVVHLAGKAHDLKKSNSPQVYYDVNFELTKILYDKFLKSNASKFIFISSVKAAADSVKTVLTEDLIPNPQTDYGKSKLMAENYITSQLLPPGKSYYILRPCMIHGPGNKGNLNLLYQFVKRKIPYPLAAFENKRSFLSVENLCYVIDSFIKGDNIPSDIYNVADDGALSTNQVINILASPLNIIPNLWQISPKLIKLSAKIGDLLKLPLNTERLTKLTEDYVVANKKVKSVLKSNLPLTAAEGLTQTAKSFTKV